jgi:hypothetical protein
VIPRLLSRAAGEADATFPQAPMMARTHSAPTARSRTYSRATSLTISARTMASSSAASSVTSRLLYSYFYTRHLHLHGFQLRRTTSVSSLQALSNKAKERDCLSQRPRRGSFSRMFVGRNIRSDADIERGRTPSPSRDSCVSAVRESSTMFESCSMNGSSSPALINQHLKHQQKHDTLCIASRSSTFG